MDDRARGGAAAIHWPGVGLSFCLTLAILELAAMATSMVMEQRVNPSAMLIAFFLALMVTGIRIRRCWAFLPPGSGPDHIQNNT